jgi:ATP-dependent DNA helicase RecG
VFAESKSDKSIDRLKAFKTAKNGFELAELDLKQRGSGALSGGKQWGVSDIAMEALRNLKMVEAARTEAKTIADTDHKLQKYPALRTCMENKKEIHFE